MDSDASSIQTLDVPVWAANFTTATNSTEAGFRRIQYQYANGGVQNYDPGKTPGPDMSIPVVTHPLLGRTLRIHLNLGQMRLEAFPGGPNSYKEGDDYYFRVDFVLDPDYPLSQPDSFNLINQVHQASDSGSPPVEFDVYSGHIKAHGEGPGGASYTKDLGPIQVNTKYKLVYRVKFSSTAASSLLQVWLNGKEVLPVFQLPVPTLVGGNSYWKGATAYCRATLSPLTVYQNAHRYGKTFASVN